MADAETGRILGAAIPGVVPPMLGDRGDIGFEDVRPDAQDLIGVRVSSRAVEAAASARGIAVHLHPWNEGTERSGLRRDALYLVRSDGHVALASVGEDAAAPTRFVRRWRKEAGRDVPGNGPARDFPGGV